MTVDRLCFQSKAKLFRDHATREMAKSAEYANVEQQLDALLVLGDRVLAACEDSLEFGRVGGIAERLNSIWAAKDNVGDLGKASEELLEDIELWLKVILWLVAPTAQRNITLYPLIRDLGLLLQPELDRDVDDYHQISDPARQLIFLSYRHRNPLTHSTRDWPEYKTRFLPAGLVTLLAPLHKHYNDLVDRLHGLVASPILDDQVVGLLKLVDSERCGHLDHFAARERFIQKVLQQLDTVRQAGGYLLVTGVEGSGKSALCAKLTEELSQGDDLGPYAIQTRQAAPWLPNVLLHLGKQSNQPGEIVRLLIAQINTLLLKPLSLPEPCDYAAPGLAIGPAMTWDTGMTPLGGKSQPRLDLIGAEHLYVLPERYGNAAQNPRLQLRREPVVSEIVQYRRALYSGLEQVAREHGPVTLIIDAVDEISPDGTGLDFLPEHLPKGIVALLTARHNAGIVKWLKNTRDATRLQLPLLQQDEIPLVTGIDSRKGKAEARFNERVWQASQGLPMLVVAAARETQQYRDDLVAVPVDEISKSFWEHQVSKWSADSPNAARILGDVLLLLALFEPATSLDLGSVQSFLTHRQISLSQADLEQLLNPVAVQLEGWEAGQVKLGLSELGRYIREKHWSRIDLQRALQAVTDWLAVEEELEAKILAPFLQFWMGSPPKGVSQAQMVMLIERLKQRRASNLLYDVYSLSRGRRSNDNLLVPSAEQCLRAAAELDDARAMLALGSRLVDGAGLTQDAVQGAKWLGRAAENNDISAMCDLGNRLLDGDGLPQDCRQGEAWLRRAAQTDNSGAILMLGMRLLQGSGVAQNVEEGEQLIRRLADEGDRVAINLLGILLIGGHCLAQNVEEGEQWLSQAVDMGDDVAMWLLGACYLRGYGLPQDVQAGERWLRQAVEAGNAFALIMLSTCQFEGLWLRQNTAEGERMLRDLARAGNKDAMSLLGVRLLDGAGLDQNIQEGETFLRYAADAGVTHAMLSLGLHLLQGTALARNASKGEQWLYRAAEEDSLYAAQVLGDCLLDGKGLRRNPTKGEQWLRRSATFGNEMAMADLGLRLLHGVGLPKDALEGEQWLHKAVSWGSSMAMFILGQSLISGSGLNLDTQGGEQLLRKSADMGVTGAMQALAVHLIDGRGSDRSLVEGERLLRRAAEIGDTNAMTVLGWRLMDGIGLTQNVNEGEQWLRRAAAKGNVEAMRVLGVHLLEGMGLNPNSQEGEHWLTEAARKGNLRAMVALGERMVDGNGLSRDSRRGGAWLRKAAKAGDAQAIMVLAQRLSQGKGLGRNTQEAKLWSKKAIAIGNSLALVAAGRASYKDGDLAAAAHAFLQAFQLGSSEAGNNLAYMTRRAELPPDINVPPVPELLAQYIETRNPIGLTNHALCLAAGFQYNQDWHAADQIIASIKSAHTVMKWWYTELASQDDPESHLVVGWLARHRLIRDPKDISVAEHMARARAGGWNIPEWMDTPTLQEPA